jgi:HEAT repeat protein
MFEGMDEGWQDRVALECEIMNDADLESLRSALSDKNPHARTMAARALGILADRDSADALAELVKSDPSYLVRIRAVESLGFLKMKSDIIQLAIKDEQGGVRWSARLAADQLKSKDDFAGQVRRAFSVGIERDDMGQAEVGLSAPDITVQTMAGQPFRLSSVLGKQPIAIYFAAFDG